MSLKLNADAHQWHRLWSMRWIIVSAFLASVAAAYALLPADWLPAIPNWVKATLALATVFTTGAAGVSRVLQQAGLVSAVPLPPADPPKSGDAP